MLHTASQHLEPPSGGRTRADARSVAELQEAQLEDPDPEFATAIDENAEIIDRKRRWRGARERVGGPAHAEGVEHIRRKFNKAFRE